MQGAWSYVRGQVFNLPSEPNHISTSFVVSYASTPNNTLQIWVRLWRCSCLVDWFCYQMIAKPGNKTATPSWPDPSQIAKLMGPTWGPPGSCRPQMGPMLAPWTLLSGIPLLVCLCHNNDVCITLLHWSVLSSDRRLISAFLLACGTLE